MNAPARIIPGQSGFRDGQAWGPLAETWSTGAEISLTYQEGLPAEPGHALGWMPQHAQEPTVTWSSGATGGAFALCDFLAIHAGAEDGRDFEVRVEGQDHLPFLALHPSGQMQAIRYDPYTETFKRRILYATLRLESAIALSNGMAAGPEEDPTDDRDEE